MSRVFNVFKSSFSMIYQKVHEYRQFDRHSAEWVLLRFHKSHQVFLAHLQKSGFQIRVDSKDVHIEGNAREDEQTSCDRVGQGCFEEVHG